jgi:hypothetical protein
MSQGFARDYVVKATGETDVFVNGVKQATTSGTEIDFAIPSGVKKVTVSFVETSVDTTGSAISVQLGTSGGIVSSGYIGKSMHLEDGGNAAADTNIAGAIDGFDLRPNSRHVLGDEHIGIMELVLHDAATNHWVSSGNFCNLQAPLVWNLSVGDVALSGELTTVRILAGGNTFDRGSVNVQYDNPELAVSGIESKKAGVTDVFVNATMVAVSGTDVDWAIPSGVKKVTFMFTSMSTDGSSVPLIQLGGSGGIEETGYNANGIVLGDTIQAVTQFTTGFPISSGSSSNAISGKMELALLDAPSNTWAMSIQFSLNGGDFMQMGAGTTALDSELTTLRLTTVGGTDAFDSGAANILYDNQELDLGSGVISGGVVQVVHAVEGEVITGTTILPRDDTIPQITEGEKFLEASITPTDVANLLLIEVVLVLSTDDTENIAAAIFQDSTASALATVADRIESTSVTVTLAFKHYMTAGTASSTTFSARAGAATTGTITLNGFAGARKYGGISASSITITEYKA